MCKQGTADQRKHINLKIAEKLERIRKLESGQNQREVMAYTTLDHQLSVIERNRSTSFYIWKYNKDIIN